eukprot:COSAG05_NODE_347_length_10963_cov_157.340943_7_plen_213_part_00
MILLLIPRVPTWLATAHEELEFHLNKIRPSGATHIAPCPPVCTALIDGNPCSGVIEEAVRKHEEELKAAGTDSTFMQETDEWAADWGETILAGAPVNMSDHVFNVRHHMVNVANGTEKKPTWGRAFKRIFGRSCIYRSFQCMLHPCRKHAKNLKGSLDSPRSPSSPRSPTTDTGAIDTSGIKMVNPLMDGEMNEMADDGDKKKENVGDMSME